MPLAPGRDTRLDRTVAIKVLLAHVADDPDLRQRFEREAKTISSLNHPHICTLHDIGQQNGNSSEYLHYHWLSLFKEAFGRGRGRTRRLHGKARSVPWTEKRSVVRIAA